MIIRGITTVQTIKYWSVTFKYRNKEYNVKIKTVDGNVVGDENSVMTAQLDYFNLSDKILKKHFEYFKEAVNARELVETKFKLTQ